MNADFAMLIEHRFFLHISRTKLSALLAAKRDDKVLEKALPMLYALSYSGHLWTRGRIRTGDLRVNM